MHAACLSQTVGRAPVRSQPEARAAFPLVASRAGRVARHAGHRAVCFAVAQKATQVGVGRVRGWGFNMGLVSHEFLHCTPQPSPRKVSASCGSFGVA